MHPVLLSGLLFFFFSSSRLFPFHPCMRSIGKMCFVGLEKGETPTVYLSVLYGALLCFNTRLTNQTQPDWTRTRANDLHTQNSVFQMKDVSFPLFYLEPFLFCFFLSLLSSFILVSCYGIYGNCFYPPV